MTSLFTKLHGTTVDRFKIGHKAERITLTGSTAGSTSTDLLDRDGNPYSVTSTVFFTAYIVGKGTHTAAYEVQGCYVLGTSTVSGYVVNTYVDTGNFNEPSLSFDSNGILTVSCTGVNADTIDWTAVIDIVSI